MIFARIDNLLVAKMVHFLEKALDHTAEKSTITLTHCFEASLSQQDFQI